LVVVAILQLLHPISISLTVFLMVFFAFVFILHDAEPICKVVGLFGCVDGLNLVVKVVELFEELLYAEAVLSSHHSLEAVDVLAFHINFVVFKQLD
jgi:hypothetical protein